MRKEVYLLIAAVLFFMVLSSFNKNTPPTTPVATNTLALTSTNTPAVTATETSTNTPNATQTAAAVIATQTAVAVATQTAIAALVSVPGGTYTQTDGTNSFSHTISAFKMGKYEVTYELWYTVYQWAIANGYAFANVGTEGCCGGAGGAPTTAKYEPVTTINWRDMMVWCNAYSQKEGLTPVYCSDAGFTTPIKNSTDGAYGSSINTTAGSFDNPYVNWSANGYRLPTEGEWQYAASYKDGLSWTPYNYASGATADWTDAAATGLVAWYSANSGYVTHDVGGKTPNALGIYDMSGNVWEWCWDWYGIYPSTSTDYKGLASGSGRVVRGGSYSDYAGYLRAGDRYDNGPYLAHDSLGFRFARTY